jgi:hypothetical protein
MKEELGLAQEGQLQYVILVPILPKIPGDEKKLVDESGSPSERRPPAANIHIRSSLMMSPKWRPFPKSKFVPGRRLIRRRGVDEVLWLKTGRDRR